MQNNRQNNEAVFVQCWYDDLLDFSTSAGVLSWVSLRLSLLMEAAMAASLRGGGLAGDIANATRADCLATGIMGRAGWIIVRCGFLPREATRLVMI